MLMIKPRVCQCERDGDVMLSGCLYDVCVRVGVWEAVMWYRGVVACSVLGRSLA